MHLRFENSIELEDRDNPVFSIALAPEARIAIAGPARSSLSVWDTHTGEAIDWSYDGRSTIALAVTPDMRRLICRSKLGGESGLSTQVWEIKMAIGRPFLRLMTLQRNLPSSMGLAVSPDGRLTAWGKGRSIQIWDVENGEPFRTLDGGSEEIQSLKFSPDGCLIASAGANGLQILDIESGQLHLQCGDPLVPYTLGVAPDGRSFLAAREDGSLKIFDARRGSCTRSWRAHDSAFNVIAVSSDGRKVVSGSLNDRTLRVWDIENPRIAAHKTLPFGILALDLKRSLLAVGDRGGNVLFLYSRELVGTPVVTPTRLWHFGKWSLYQAEEGGAYQRRQIEPSSWADELTVFCDWCGKRSAPPATVLDAIRGVAKAARLESGASPCLKLRDEAWNERRLLSHCSLCREPLRYNPFVVDAVERFASRQVDNRAEQSTPARNAE